MSSLKQKLSISAFSALLFILVNLPQTYKFTHVFTGIKTLQGGNGCATGNGLLLHTVIFFLLTLLSMGYPFNFLKMKFSIYGSLIFFLIASSAMYALTNSLFGGGLLSKGCPTIYGLLLHAFVYGAILVAVMYLPEKQ